MNNFLYNVLIKSASAVILSLFIPVCWAAGESAAVSGKITYSQYLDRIKLHLPELKKNAIRREKAKNSIYSAGSAGDIHLSGETGYSRSDILSGSNSAEKKDFSSRMGLTKKVAETGTTLSAGAGYNRTEYSLSGDQAFHYPSLFVKFSQSLLQNTFGKIDRYAVNNARMQYEIEKLREQETGKSDLNYYRKLYFNWIRYREELAMINSSIATAKKLDESIRGRIKSGMVNSADLYSSAAAVLKYQIAYEELKSEINILETELDIFFGSSLKNSISPDDSEFSLYYKKSLKAGYPEIKFENTANAEIFRITKNNLKYTADISENRLLPKLDLVGEYTKKSENKSFSGSVGNLDSSDYYIGFAFSYPLQNTENRSKAEEIRLSIEELNSEYAISEDSYVKSLNAVKTRYNDSVRLINLREKRIETLEEKYRFEMKKYQQSQLDLEILINTSVEIANEKITLVRLKKQIIENYIDYMDLTGRGEDL